jgi:hypothetical protein
VRTFRSPFLLGLAVTAGCLATGCTALGYPGDPAPGTAQASAPAPAAPKPALLGPRLAGLLLPASSMPAGFTTDASATRDSGAQRPSDSAAPVPAGQACLALTQTGFIRVSGIGTSDFAEHDFLSRDQAQEITEEIDVFTGSDAKKAMTKLWRVFGACKSFSYPSDGTTASNTLTRSRVTGAGDDAITAVIVSPLFKGGQTITAVRVGSQVVTTLDSSSGLDLGAPAVGYAEKIATRLAAAG